MFYICFFFFQILAAETPFVAFNWFRLWCIAHKVSLNWKERENFISRSIPVLCITKLLLFISTFRKLLLIRQPFSVISAFNRGVSHIQWNALNQCRDAERLFGGTSKDQSLEALTQLDGYIKLLHIEKQTSASSVWSLILIKF